MSNVPDGSAETSRLPNGPPAKSLEAINFDYDPV